MGERKVKGGLLEVEEMRTLILLLVALILPVVAVVIAMAAAVIVKAKMGVELSRSKSSQTSAPICS
jgi:hypothetical protein